MLKNKYLISGITVLVLAVIAVVIFFVLGSDNEPELSTVILTNEAKYGYLELGQAYGGPVHLPLPVKTEAALVEGWIDTGSCAPGQGRYFYKTNPQSNKKLDYLLIYNASDVLIGVYFYSKETSLPEPWKIAQELNPFTDSLIDYPHSNVAVYLVTAQTPAVKIGKQTFLQLN